eukprot:gene10480-biopygen9830
MLCRNCRRIFWSFIDTQTSLERVSASTRLSASAQLASRPAATRADKAGCGCRGRLTCYGSTAGPIIDAWRLTGQTGKVIPPLTLSTTGPGREGDDDIWAVVKTADDASQKLLADPAQPAPA